MEWIDWVKANATELLAIWGCVITVVSIIVKLTPSKRDDGIWAVILKILNALALNPNEKKQEEKEKLEAEMSVRDNATTRRNLTNALR